jgi:SNF2 family DNA or RNA helicase
MHNYQDKLLNHMLKNGMRGLFLEMGMGKTIIALKFIKYHMAQNNVRKTLIIAPLRVAQSTWIEECLKWNDFSDIKIVSCCGSASERLNAFRQEADIYCLNRENCVWLIQNVDVRQFDLLVLDELSSFKSIGRTTMVNALGKKISYFGSKRFIAISQVRKHFKYVIGLTGTPMPNHYMELFPQIYLLNPEIFGDNFYRFRNKYFKENPYNGNWDLKEGSENKILNKMDQIAVSLRAEDYLDMPEKIFNDLWLKPEKSFLKRYFDMKKNWIDKESNISTENVIAKLSQMASGFLYNEEKQIYRVHNLMIDALREIVEFTDDNLLIFVNFRAEVELIKETFPDISRVLISKRDIEDWNSGNIKIAISHPASTGHGLNIQNGGHTIVWYGLSWSLELYQQANGRLYRQGQKSKTVIIHRLMVQGTIHDRVKELLEGKIKRQDILLDHVKLWEYTGQGY